MNHWEGESFESIINNDFQVTNAGPLHEPIRKISIRRDEKLHLILETVCPETAQSKH
jgi:hypothetical protein